jgi:hypothetical protein
MTEEIEARLRNQKRERVEVLVKEKLYRWVNHKLEVAWLPPGRRAHDCAVQLAGALSLGPCARGERRRRKRLQPMSSSARRVEQAIDSARLFGLV